MFNKKIALMLAVLFASSVVFAGCGSSAKPQAGEQKVEKKVLKLSSVLPNSHPTNRGMLLFAEKVKEKTKGSIEIQVFPTSQLGEQRDNLEQLKMGTLDMCMTSTGPLGQFVPTVDALSLPYVFRDTAHLHKVMDGKPAQMLAEDINKAGFTFLYWNDSGSRNLINNKRPITTPEDLKGVKVRVMNSQLMVNTLNSMGAIATPMGQGEVYSALQQGVLDGWENSPTTLLVLKLYEVSKYFSWTKHFMSPDAVVMSKKVYDKLTPAEQKAIMEASKEASIEQRKYWAEDEKKAVDELVVKGVKFNDVPDIKPFQDRVKPVWKQYTDKNGTALLDAIQDTK